MATAHQPSADRSPVSPVSPAARSAGILLHRRGPAARVEVLLAHMGGPFWARRDDGAWTIPKGEHGQVEDDPLAVARREFEEELGAAPPHGPAQPLGEVRQPGGKRVTAWALAGDFDPATLRSNTFQLEWPPGSGTVHEFPEIDRVAWFDLATARRKLLRGQVPLLDRLAVALGSLG